MTEPAASADTAASLDSSPAMAMPTLHRAVIGPIGNDYYLPIFSRFEAAGEATLSWNWSACVYNLNWMIFRGLWGAALVFAGSLLGLALLLVALGQVVFDWPPEGVYGLLATGLALGCLVSGAWGNALFFNHSRQAMMDAIQANPTLALACAQLERQASSRQRFITLLTVNALLLALAAGAYLLLTQGDAAPETRQTMSPPTAAAVTSASEPALVSVSSPASAPEPMALTADPAASAGEPAAQDLPATPVQAGASGVSTPLTSVAQPVTAPASASAPVSSALATTPAPGSEMAPTAAPAPTPVYYINAGLFANPDNANNTLAKLKAAGLPAFSQTLATAQGPRTRVRVGPLTRRAQAEATVQKIKALKLDAALAKAGT